MWLLSFLFRIILYKDIGFDFKKEFIEGKNNALLACF